MQEQSNVHRGTCHSSILFYLHSCQTIQWQATTEWLFLSLHFQTMSREIKSSHFNLVLLSLSVVVEYMMKIRWQPPQHLVILLNRAMSIELWCSQCFHFKKYLMNKWLTTLIQLHFAFFVMSQKNLSSHVFILIIFS